MYSDKVIDVLKNLSVTIDMEDHRKELDMLVNNNLRNEEKRRVKRSLEKIVYQTASGYGAELALMSTGLFTSSSPIVEDSRSLNFSQLKTDLVCENIRAEVKSKTNNNDNWYVSEAQYNSLAYAKSFNQYIIVVTYKDIEKICFKYAPRFIIDIANYKQYLSKEYFPGRVSYRYDHEEAVRNKHCIDLRR